MFDPFGRLRFEAPILDRTADIRWSTKAGASCERKGIVFSHFGTSYVTALIWDGKYDLDLHVVEPPDGRIGGPDHYVSQRRPNLELRYGLGTLRRFGLRGSAPDVAGPVAGTSQVLLYALPPQNQRGEGDIYFHVEFASRRNPAIPPFCGATPLATASFKLFHLDSGKADLKGGSFAPVACGTSWDTDHYYQRFKWKF